ncbi:pyridoxamine 5'-phosphate oxidase family protein [Candidatus Lokiarchaeum ossiferum]|uniref:pyridoxamine 5'-phosphate oxidase family protein n=1 Tax=Candidatus Lokiarchaeum ossiferum TaxID=2951803 RepID=UPI00352DD183
MNFEEEREKVIKLGLQLIKESQFAFLTTLDENGLPHTRSMFNLRGKSFFPTIQPTLEPYQDGFSIFFSTNQSSSKYQHVLKDPTACVLITRTEEFLGLSLNGKLKIVEDMEFKKGLWVEGSEQYYSLGVNDPDYIIMQFIPSSLEWWGSGIKSKFDL